MTLVIQYFISEAHQSIDGWFFPLDQLIFFERRFKVGWYFAICANRRLAG